jgi:hypothetical protein
MHRIDTADDSSSSTGWQYRQVLTDGPARRYRLLEPSQMPLRILQDQQCPLRRKVGTDLSNAHL